MDSQVQKADISENATIESYLNTLCAPLHDLPQDTQGEIRQEIGAHLQSLIAMKREPNRVLESALQQFGDPKEIGRLLALEWENREWDLGGLSLLERIEKVRQATVTMQDDWQKTTFAKRIVWLFPLIVSPSLVSLVKDTLLHKNFALDQMLAIAMFFLCGLALVVSFTLAWKDWHHAQMQGKSVISRVRFALAQVAMGLYALMPLTFSSATMLHQPAAYLALIWLGVVALLLVTFLLVLLVFEPSRKTKSVTLAWTGWGAVCGFVIIPIGFRLLTALGVTAYWAQGPIVFLITFILGRWFWKGQTAKRQQKTE